MTDDKLNGLFKQIETPPVDEAAKRRAIDAAMAEFTAHQRQNTRVTTPERQGFRPRFRPIRDGNENGRSKTMNFLSRRVLYRGLATASVISVVSVVVFQAYQGYLDYTERAKMTEKLAIESAARTSISEYDISEGLMPADQAEAGVEYVQPGRANKSLVQAESPIALSPPNAHSNRMPRMAEVLAPAEPSVAHRPQSKLQPASSPDVIPPRAYQEEGRDRFENFELNPIKRVGEEPVSTFSTDVDTASYSFVRRQLNQGLLPQKDAVRVEEMINYFDYDYPLPESKQQPFQASVAITPSPWAEGKQLIHIGIKGYDIDPAEQPDSNLVFLLDASGSMSSPDKLPLVKQSMGLLLDSLKPEDTVGIVVYAGAAGKVLDPTPVKEKQKILDALNRLQAGGSTAGAEGIQLAYQLAQASFKEDAVNRIILATDGDFNVGITNYEELKGFVERKRKQGIFLSVFGFGQGNYQDQMMQVLAQNGNGVAAYIDTLSEAQKVLIHEATSSLFPIAKDVKIQVEFNPDTVAEYRLIGYETRHLEREDFNNDAVDAGDIGAGHTVTAIYEITPVGSEAQLIDESRYAKKAPAENDLDFNNEYAFLKIRYKLPDEEISKLITQPIGKELARANGSIRQETRFATAVAAFAQMLRGGKYTGDFSYDDVIKLAQASKGEDLYGYRTEFIQLVRKAKIAAPM